MANDTTFSKQDTLRIKGMAIMMMLFHHLFGFPDRMPDGLVLYDIQIGGEFLSYHVAVFCKLCVMIYIVIGGYGTFLSSRRSSRKQRKLLQKIQGMYIEYWIVVFIFVPLSCIIGSNVFDLFTFAKTLVGISHEYCGEWWFFLPYVIVTIVYWVISKAVEYQKNPIWVELLVLVFLYVGVLEKDRIIPYAISSFLPISILLSGIDFLPGFLFGAFLAKHRIMDKGKKLLQSRDPVFVFFTLFFSILLSYIVRINLVDRYDLIVVCLFLPALICSCLLEGKMGTGLEILGTKSMSIWLTYTFICYQFFNSEIYALLSPILIFAVLLSVCYVIAIPIGMFKTFLNKPKKRMEI